MTNFSSIRVKNPKKIIIGHLNINSIPKKLSSIMKIIKGKLDIFLISEKKVDEFFPTSQFSAEGSKKPFRRDRKIGAGGLQLYVDENITAKELRSLNPANDTETISVEINFKKQKCIIIGIYHPPNQNDIYFLDELGKLLDFYSQSHERIQILGDLNYGTWFFQHRKIYGKL